MYSKSSLVGIDEEVLVKMLMGDNHWRHRFIGAKGIPAKPGWGFEFDMKGLPRPEGDVDLLVCEKGIPEKATAIEIKRIKVGRTTLNWKRMAKAIDQPVEVTKWVKQKEKDMISA